MLHKIYSDLPSFKTVKFHKGLNLILAEKAQHSSDGKTRNGAGKSSLVELINLLLGGDIKIGTVLKAKELENYSFGIDLELLNQQIIIERSGGAAGKVIVKKLPKNLQLSELDGQYYISNDEWRALLGKYIFGLDRNAAKIKYSPKFRSLCSYFARPTKGFDSPTKFFPQQPIWSAQVSIAYLLKLDWRVVKDFESIRQKDGLIKSLNQAANEGVLGQIIGSASDLRTDIHMKQSNMESVAKAITEFKVLPEYEEKEARASDISKKLAQISAEDTTDKEWLAQLERTIDEEVEPDHSKVEKLFSEASIELPSLVKKRFEEVSVFHGSIVKNRKEHLKQEMDSISSRVKERLKEKKVLDDERSDIMSLLQSHGALDQYTKLRSNLSKIEADLEVLKKKLEMTEDLDDKKIELKIERQNLLRKMRIDHAERDDLIRDAVISFANISSELYDESGKFVVDPTVNGPKFEFDIPGGKSTGKNKMQIFCFDMTLMKIWANEKNRPDFLIHDSIVFDGVDERQIAKALIVGARMAKEYNFQYIVTMNSDDMPDMSKFPEFNLDDYKVDITINDTETGGLFGLRFQ